ncbi:MAG: ATP-binding protein [Nitrospinota bacterium]
MKNNKILVIDDEQEILDEYVRVLAGNGSEQNRELASIAGELGLKPTEQPLNNREKYDLTVSLSGEEGVMRVERSLKKERPFAVIFCDMRMTDGLDGIETGKKIRKLDRQVEIVFVTGYSDHTRHSIVKQIGSPEKLLYLKKPFDPDEIRQLALKLTISWQMEQDLKAALIQAKAADKAKSDFLSLVTHEFKTPLSGIIGSVQTLNSASGKTTPGNSKRFLEMAERSAFRLLGMVNEILAFSRTQSQQAVFKPETFDGGDFLESLAREEIEPLFKTKPVKFTMDAPSIKVYADRQKLRHIIMNLVTNAAKFTSSGSVNIRCRKNGNNDVCFSVSDTGRGIPEEHTEKIFNEFYQIDRQVDEQQGTGLGLAIVRQYVRLHGGDISVESIEGDGSTFHFTLPNAP